MKDPLTEARLFLPFLLTLRCQRGSVRAPGGDVSASARPVEDLYGDRAVICLPCEVCGGVCKGPGR